MKEEFFFLWVNNYVLRFERGQVMGKQTQASTRFRKEHKEADTAINKVQPFLIWGPRGASLLEEPTERRWFGSQPDAFPSASSLSWIYLASPWHSQASSGLPCRDRAAQNESGWLAVPKREHWELILHVLPSSEITFCLGRGRGTKIIYPPGEETFPPLGGNVRRKE